MTNQEIADRVRIGRELRAMRLRAHVTQRIVAERMRTNRPIVARIEKGTHSPSLDTLCRYCDACGRSITELFVVDTPEAAE